MKTAKRNEMEALVRASAPDSALRPAADFWDDFRARARLRAREETPASEDGGARIRLPLWRWAAAACVAGLMAGAFLLLTSPAPALGGEGSSFHSVDVLATHSAVMILEDARGDSAVLWVVDMTIENGGDS